jgi:L-alanine-DL-glutamate epimerase-like enolase superfamily enzyme
MKITGIDAAIVNLPADEPLAGAVVRPGATRPTVLLDVQTDSGLQGIGFTFLGAGLTPALLRAVEGLGEMCLGLDPLSITAVRKKLETAAGGAGPAGVFTLALAAIDMALWDIKGKALGLPLWKLLGGSGEPVPTYASGAMMRELPLDAAVTAAGRLLDGGFREMKMQLALPGESSPAAEVERARLVREQVGPDVRLMCDINQRWRVDQAIAIGRRLEEVGLFWLEDIVAHDDVAGMARVASALTTPLAAGEYVYGLSPFRSMLEAGSVGIVMIDPFRAGGITQWLKIAALAEAFNLPVVSHLAPEVQVHLVGAIPNGLTVEYMPWSIRLFEEVPRPDHGMLAMPEDPGLGLRVDRDAVRRFRA